MCVDAMRCGGHCPECKGEAERHRRKREAIRKMMATKAAKRAAKQRQTEQK